MFVFGQRYVLFVPSLCCLLGFGQRCSLPGLLLGWLKNKSAGPSRLFKEVLSWKAAMPECVLLVQVGDFFEAWGVDAVMLVQWCGLMPMARKPRAGFPAIAVSLQQTLDGLTRAGLSAAVYKQTAYLI